MYNKLVGLAIFIALTLSSAASYADADTTSKLTYLIDVKGLSAFGKLIVIDPGHGGTDTGAIGELGTREKDVTLKIGQELKTLLEKNGSKVIMTRNRDQDVYGPFASPTQELQARVDIANKAKADLFISVHVDAYSDQGAGGTTTYYFNKTSQDNLLAQCVENGLNDKLHLTDRGERSNELYVLENTTMPAVLTEVAYITNPLEEKLIQTSAFQKEAALGIYNGIKAYYGTAVDTQVPKES